VLCDLGTLDTLPARELRAGYAETVKYGLIDDPAFFDWCEANANAVLAGSGDARRTAVRAAVAAKARIVAADEREAGVRALLNLGHTFGHALEAETGFGPDLLHGEAVAIGMVAAGELSLELGLWGASEQRRQRAVIAAAGLPQQWPALDPEAVLQCLQGDKKVRDGKVRFVLPTGLGSVQIRDDVTPEQVLAALQRCG